MNYCTTCFYPDTKPDLEFNQDGVCSACIAFEQRKKINWKEREKEFVEVVKNIKKRSHGNYDCIVPVSGGKDSTGRL